jgi:threonine efflux protein
MVEAFATIALLHWTVLLTPGVNFLLLAQLSASASRTTAWWAVLGITTATFTWATLAVLGVGAVFAAHPIVRQVVQVAGGAYLLYVAYKLWSSKGGVPATLAKMEAKIETKTDTAALTKPNVINAPTRLAAYRLGFVTNMLNPKPALFFGSMFVTALPPQAELPAVSAAVGMVYVNAVVWHGFLVLLFSSPPVQRVHARLAQGFNRVAGVLVGFFGVKLLAAVWQELRGKSAA